MESTLRRPTGKETEDDLIRLQEEYSRCSSFKPSANVVKVNKKEAPKIMPTESLVPVLSEIREKNIDITEFEFHAPPVVKMQCVKREDKRRQFCEEQSSSVSSPSTRCPVEDLATLKGVVHEENARKLSKMTEEEISLARQELFQKCDTKLIEFLKRRSEQRERPEGSQREEAEKTSLRSDSDQTSSPALPMDEFPVQPTTKWPHMDTPEPEKLAWMGSLPDTTHQQHLFTARFDFKGNLVPPKAEIPMHVGLHHHGKEPEVPGYTLEELLRLCRAQVMNQRVLALTTLANIVGLAKSGAYNDILLPVSLIRSLLESNMCTITRYALDDSAVSVVVAACRLLASFLHNPFDEICLDISYALSLDTSQLALAPVQSTDAGNDDGADEDDEELCNRDTILGLLRMDTLQRLRYLLEVVQPPSGRCVTDIFSILIRICRHSESACRQIFDCPRLMEVVATLFLPSSWQTRGTDQSFYPTYGVPYWGAVKLCRIIANANPQLALSLVEKHHLGEIIIRYIIMDPEDMMIPLEDAYRLVVEAYRLWSQLLAHSLCGEYFSDLFETMVNHIRAAVCLDPGERGNQLKWDRAASLALAIGQYASSIKMADINTKLPLKGVVEVIAMALMKLLRDRIHDAAPSYYYLIASLANCCTAVVSCDRTAVDPRQFETMIKDLVPAFEAIFGDRFARESQRPPRTPVRLLPHDPAFLPSLESVGGGSLVKLIRDASLYPVFSSLRRLRLAFESH